MESAGGASEHSRAGALRGGAEGTRDCGVSYGTFSVRINYKCANLLRRFVLFVNIPMMTI